MSAGDGTKRPKGGKVTSEGLMPRVVGTKDRGGINARSRDEDEWRDDS